MDPAGYDRMLVITNNWHMPRVKAIFSHVLSLPRYSTEEELEELKNRRAVEDEANRIKDAKKAAVAEGVSSGETAKEKKARPPALSLSARRPSYSSSSSKASKNQQQQPGTVDQDNKSQIQVSFVSVDAGVSDSETLQARIEKEQQAQVTFEELTKKKLTSMQGLHDWLFSEHGAYASSRLTQSAQKQQQNKLNPALLKSY